MPPVHLWNPPYCGEIGLRIAADGIWFYQGSPIGRMPLVKLFASILRKDPERYVLVTPVEKIGIEVEDAPFLAVELEQRERDGRAVLAFRTNVDDWVEVDADHPLRFERGPPTASSLTCACAEISGRLSKELCSMTSSSLGLCVTSRV